MAHGIIDTFLTTGPMSRFCCDLLPMFKVMLKSGIELNLDEKVDLKSLRIFYMKDDGGNPIVSPVDTELIGAQQRVIKKWKEVHQKEAEMLILPRMKYSTLLWSNKMASEPNSPSFAAELNLLDGEINTPMELLKWMFGKSEHTLPALGLALFEKFVDTKSDMHKVTI